MTSDRELGMHRRISRRQFCQGTSVAIGASLAPWLRADEFAGSPEIAAGYYPPGLTGLRGSHAGSFETAHALVHQGRRWDSGVDTGEGPFDMVVVGAGISGLAAAWFYRRERPDARILVLDNHGEFGGHATRNEFSYGGKTYIGYGGCQSIDTPSSYSPEALGLLKSLGIELDRFYQAYDRQFYQKLGLQGGFWLDREHFGIDRLVRGSPIGWGRRGDESREELQRFADSITTDGEDAKILFQLLTSVTDVLAGKTPAEKFQYLSGLSYESYLRRHFGLSDYLARLINRLPCGLWGAGTDAISAREAMYLGLPGFAGLGLEPQRDDPYYGEHEDEPYIFHFPDGNAAIARLLVRSLVPAAAPGGDMFDIVEAPFDYTALDRSGQGVKIRLNATVVRIEHRGASAGGTAGAGSVDVRYVKAGVAHDVNARQVIFAGYSAMIPHVCPEFPAAQAEAFAGLVKIPLLYANTLVRNWESFVQLGIQRIQFPGGLIDNVALDFPVSLGGYVFAHSPQDPMILHWSYFPTVPGQGLDARTQNRLGRQKMLGLSFEDYERALRSQAGAALSAGGFDPARDILGITVNRWPHGYAYEYNDLVDPREYNRYKGPHLKARQPFGRVSIAGSDAEALAYVNGAVDSAWRAVQERLAAG
jgi:spermidine dehydrogenase